MSAGADGLLNAWRESAEYWRKHRQIVRRMFAPVTDAIIEDARISPGHRVLDVAGGPGEPALTIAETVLPGGSVVYTDAVSEMLETASSEAEQRKITNISFQQCSGENLPFAANSFDAVTCRFGVMLFNEPGKSLREMLRVTRLGGSITLAVWHTSEMNPFLNSITKVMARYVEAPPADPNAPGAFRFAEPGSLADLFREAGAANVRERIFSFKIEAPIIPREFWPLRVELSDTLRNKVKELSPIQLASVEADVQQEIGGYFDGSGMSFPASAIIVSGMKDIAQN